MPDYTLVITTSDGSQKPTLSTFPDDATAIGDTGKFVSTEHPSVALARGTGDEAEWLGAWDFEDGRPAWSPDS